MVLDSQVLRDKIVTSFDKFYSGVTTLWKELGLAVPDIDSRNEVILMHINALFGNMIQEEEENRNKVKEKIEELASKIFTLCTDLEIEVFEPNEMLPLLYLEKELAEKYDQLICQRDNRLEEYHKYRKTEGKHCDYLGVPPLQIHKNIPSSKDLEEIQQHIELLLREKEKRHYKFKAIREQILDYVKLIEARPSLPLEKKMLYDDIDTIPLTQDSMKTINSIKEKYEINYEVNYLQSEELKEKLKSYWNKLEVEHDYQNNFLEKHSGYSDETIIALKRELRECERKRKANLEMYLEKQKKELNYLWDQCFLGPLTRQLFFDSLTDDMTNEEILNKYESYFEKTKAFYTNNLPLLKKFEKWNELFEKMKEFSNRQCTPARLNNRGGTLLKEEKERNRINNLLPKLENEMKNEAKEYTNKENQPFLVFDQPLEEFIAQKWEVYMQEKENEKTVRLHYKPQKITTPISNIRKRKETTPTPNASKRFCLQNNATMFSNTLRATPRTPQVTPRTPILQSSQIPKILKPASASKHHLTPFGTRSRVLQKLRKSYEKKKKASYHPEESIIIKTPPQGEVHPSEVNYAKFKNDLHSTQDILQSTVSNPSFYPTSLSKSKPASSKKIVY